MMKTVIIFTLIVFLLSPTILIGSDDFLVDDYRLTISEGEFYATHNRDSSVSFIDGDCVGCCNNECDSLFYNDEAGEETDEWFEEDFKEWLEEQGVDKGATMGW